MWRGKAIGSYQTTRVSDVSVRMRNLMRNPGRSVSWRLRRWTLRAGRLLKYPWRWTARLALERQGVLECLAGRPPDALAPDSDDLLFLFNMVRRKRPKCILEFGSGCSTRAMAEGLKKNMLAGDTGARLISIEQDPRWAEATKSYLGNDFPMVEILHRPAVGIQYEGRPAWRFEDVPPLKADMVYLDGPVLVPGRDVAVDILELESELSDTCTIIVDGRWENVTFLTHHLAHPHTVKRRFLHGNSVIQLTLAKA